MTGHTSSLGMFVCETRALIKCPGLAAVRWGGGGSASTMYDDKNDGNVTSTG